jgi:hypothetical protein
VIVAILYQAQQLVEVGIIWLCLNGAAREW